MNLTVVPSIQHSSQDRPPPVRAGCESPLRFLESFQSLDKRHKPVFDLIFTLWPFLTCVTFCQVERSEMGNYLIFQSCHPGSSLFPQNSPCKRRGSHFRSRLSSRFSQSWQKLPDAFSMPPREPSAEPTGPFSVSWAHQAHFLSSKLQTFSPVVELPCYIVSHLLCRVFFKCVSRCCEHFAIFLTFADRCSATFPFSVHCLVPKLMPRVLGLWIAAHPHHHPTSGFQILFQSVFAA